MVGAVRIEVPERVRSSWKEWFGAQQVPALVADTERRAAAAIEAWELDAVEPLGEGNVAIVCACRHHGDPAVLKVTPRMRHQTHRSDETDALRVWAGLAPDVIATRDDDWTALLERVLPGVPLKSCAAPLEAMQILGEMAARLHRHPPGTGFVSLSDGKAVESWRTRLDHAPRARADLEDLLATGGDPVLLHLDLHRGNVLSHHTGWRVVDPKPRAGDRHAECFCFLAMARDLPERGAATALDAWVARYAAAAELDEARLRRWITVRAEAELGWWPPGQPGWGDHMRRLLAAL